MKNQFRLNPFSFVQICLNKSLQIILQNKIEYIDANNNSKYSKELDNSISELKIYSNIKGDIAEEEVKLNGRDAYIISYTMTQNDVEFEIKQAIFIDSKTAYVLTTTVPGELKDENSETIDNIISSFMK